MESLHFSSEREKARSLRSLATLARLHLGTAPIDWISNDPCLLQCGVCLFVNSSVPGQQTKVQPFENFKTSSSFFSNRHYQPDRISKWKAAQEFLTNQLHQQTISSTWKSVLCKQLCSNGHLNAMRHVRIAKTSKRKRKL